MAYQSIGRGTTANDGTGDDLRTGAGKVNANFVEVYTLLGDGSTLTTDTVTLNTATQTLTNKTITGTFTGNITGDVTGNVTGNVTGDLTGNVTGAVTGNVTGDLTGDVTGNVTGNLTGDVTGDVTGNLTGNVTGDLTGAVDLNGGVLTLDADADTTITADTDDQIDIAFGGNDRITLSTGLIDLKNDGTQSEVRLYCESANAHYAGIQAPAHADFSGNITITLPSSTDTLVGRDTTDTLTNKSLTSPTITGTGTAAFATVDTQLVLSEASLTGDGSTVLVVDPTVGVTLITSSAGAETATLADASTVGTMVNIILESDGGGDVVLTPTTFLNGSTITFADAGDQVTLVWTGSNGWAMIGAGFGAPAIA